MSENIQQNMYVSTPIITINRSGYSSVTVIESCEDVVGTGDVDESLRLGPSMSGI